MTKAERKWWHNFRSFWGKLGQRAADDTGLTGIGCIDLSGVDFASETSVWWHQWLTAWGRIATVVEHHHIRDQDRISARYWTASLRERLRHQGTPNASTG